MKNSINFLLVLFLISACKSSGISDKRYLAHLEEIKVENESNLSIEKLKYLIPKKCFDKNGTLDEAFAKGHVKNYIKEQFPFYVFSQDESYQIFYDKMIYLLGLFEYLDSGREVEEIENGIRIIETSVPGVSRDSIP